MTPYAHHNNDTYLNAYTSDLSDDLRAAFATESSFRRTRRTIARSMVRLGARMLPETPEIVDDRILVLATPLSEGDVKQAA